MGEAREHGYVPHLFFSKDFIMKIAATGTQALGIGCIAILMVFGAITAMSAFIAFLFMLAWNYVAVDVFHAPALDFWHAWGIWFLITLVGGAFRATFASRTKD